MGSATWSYLGSTFIVTAFLLSSPLFFTHHLGVSLLLLVLLAALAMFPASDAATALVNRAMMELCPRARCRDLELAKGVPPDLKSLVVVPTLPTGEAQIAEQIGRLGVHYLANADGELRFALLSDWTDAPAEHAPGRTTGCSARGAGRCPGAQPPVRRGGADGEPASTSSIAAASGARARDAGWDGSASGASCTSSIGSCGAPPTRPSCPTPAPVPRRHPLRDHARCRHAAAAGGGGAAWSARSPTR